MLFIEIELRSLVTKLADEKVPYALCGALALAAYGYPRATRDIDLLALAGSSEDIQRCARDCGFTLKAAPMTFASGTVRLQRVSKVVAGNEDVLMLDVLSVAAEIEKEMRVRTVEWEGIRLRLVDRESLIRLKLLRGDAQDLADVKSLR